MPNATHDDVLSPILRDLPLTTVAPRISTEDTLEQAQDKTQVKYAFWIMAAIQVGLQQLRMLFLFLKFPINLLSMFLLNPTLNNICGQKRRDMKLNGSFT